METVEEEFFEETAYEKDVATLLATATLSQRPGGCKVLQK